jgi:hypothetical protein
MKKFIDHLREAYTPPLEKNERYVLCTRDYSEARRAEIEFPNSHIRVVHFKNGGTKYFVIQTNL